jgi:hypothetical protein
MFSRIVARGPRLSPAAWPFPPASLSVDASGAPAGDDRTLPHRRARRLTRPATAIPCGQQTPLAHRWARCNSHNQKVLPGDFRREGEPSARIR